MEACVSFTLLATLSAEWGKNSLSISTSDYKAENGGRIKSIRGNVFVAYDHDNEDGDEMQDDEERGERRMTNKKSVQEPTRAFTRRGGLN